MTGVQTCALPIFDAGYDYVLNEIERFMRETPESDVVIRALLKHLRMEGKPQ